MAFGRLGTFGTGFGRLGHAPRTPWWLAGSTLDLDFAKNRARQAGRFYMPSALLTTTRASDAYADDTAGNWSLFGSGVPRITDKGLLVEEARTNLFLQSGTPATQSITVVSSSVYTVSVVGTGSVTLSGAGTGVASQGTPVTFTAGSTSLTVTTAGITGAFVNVNVELGAFATSPIRTTSAAATRAADGVTTAVASSGGNPFTLFARGTPNAPTTFGTNQVLAQIDDGTANNRAIFIRSLTTGALSVFETISGAATAATPAGTWAQSASGKIAIAVGSSEIAAAFNGGTVATGSPVGIATVNALRIGATNSPGAFWNGYIERVAFFPTRLTNAQLQALTT